MAGIFARLVHRFGTSGNSGPTAAKKISEIVNQVRQYAAAGQIEKARAASTQAIQVGERLHGETLELGSLLSVLGSTHLSADDYEAAEPLLARSLRIKREHGADRSSILLGVHNLATLNLQMKRYDDAISLYEEELALGSEGTFENLAERMMTVVSLIEAYRESGKPGEVNRLRAAETARLSTPGRRDLATQVLDEMMEWALRAEGHAAVAADLGPLRLEIERGRTDRQPMAIARAAFSTSAALMQLGHFGEAVELAREAIRLWTSECGLDDSHIKSARLLLGVALQNRGRELMQQRPDESIACLREALTLITAEGDHSRSHAMLLAGLSRLLRDREEFEEAESGFIESLRLLENEGSAARRDLAEVKNGLGVLYFLEGNLNAAEDVLTSALSIARESGADVASPLFNLGKVRDGLGDASGAIRFYGEAVATCTQTPEQLLEPLKALCRSLFESGQVEEAAHVGLQLVHILESDSNTDRGELANAKLNLGLIYRALGRFDDGRMMFLSAQELYEHMEKYDESDRIDVIEALGLLYVRVGDFIQAEPLLHQSERFRRQAGDVRQLAISLNGLGTFYEAVYALPIAISYYAEALALLRNVEGAGKNILSLINNLALAQHKAGQLEEAAENFEGAVILARQTGMDRRPTFSATLKNLGDVYERIGTFSARSGSPGEPLYRLAEKRYREALEHHELRGEKENQGYLGALLALGWLAYSRGLYDDAEHYYQEARGLQSRIGTVSEVVGRAEMNYASVHAARGCHKEALSIMFDGFAREDRLIHHVFSLTSESSRLNYMDRWRGNVYALVSLVLSHDHSPAERNALMDVVLRRKGIVADVLAIQSQRSPGDDGGIKRAELAAVREIEERMVLGHPCEIEVHGSLEVVRMRRERLESEISRDSIGTGDADFFRHADRRSIADALPSGSALIEILRTPIFNFSAVPALGEHRWQSPKYLAFVLLSGRPDETQLIDLGSADEIEICIEAWRQSCAGASQARDLGAGDPSLPSEWFHTGIALRRLVFDPVIAVLRESKRLFIAPDGELCRVPLEGLSTDDGGFLADSYSLSYLSTGRDLLRLSTPRLRRSSTAVVAANPNFDLGTGSTNESEVTALARGPKLDNVSFDPLPGTNKEGIQVARLLGVEPLLRDDAVEQKLKSLQSPAILHIATHGFFLADDATNDSDPTSLFSTNPLLKSGLALAGANWRAKRFVPPPAAGDGVLTAEDLARTDLRETELVVLSACETGLGAIHSGEGVFGFRRSFVLAGARTLVMSLWRVPDEQTFELMSLYYAALLRGAGRADGLREAQARLRVTHPAPFYWAAFICQGDPSPMPPNLSE